MFNLVCSNIKQFNVYVASILNTENLKTKNFIFTYINIIYKIKQKQISS